MGRGDNGAILDHATTTSGTTRDSMAALTALREAEKAAFVAKTNADPAQGYTGHRFARRRARHPTLPSITLPRRAYSECMCTIFHLFRPPQPPSVDP